MHYMNCEGVKCTTSGFPICHLDEKVCGTEVCRYYLPWPDIGNCTLRVTDATDNEQETFQKLAMSFGVGGKKVSRQRVDQIEKRALRKLRERWGETLKGAETR